MMIACKEDLINTYIENDHGELRDLYLELSRAFMSYSGFMKNFYTGKYIAICERTVCPQDCNKVPPKCIGRELTLSDLKPRTKQYAVLYKGGSYSFQSDKPIGDDIVACFDLSHSEEPLSGDFFEEKTRNKVEYVEVEDENGWHVWEFLKAYCETGGDCWFYKVGEEKYAPVIEWFDVAQGLRQGKEFYRRIETPMTEREAFIEAACNEVNATLDSDAAEDFGKIFDSGKFKLVN